MSKTCSKCGNVCDDSTIFCDACGNRFESGDNGNAQSAYYQNQSQNNSQQSYGQNSQYGYGNVQNTPQYNQGFFVQPAEQPISTGKWFLYQLLFAIPVVGLVMLIITACGGLGDGNTTFKNYARAMLIWQVIAIVLTILLVVLGVGTALSLSSSVANYPYGSYTVY